MPRVPVTDYVSQQQVPGAAPFDQASGAVLAAPAAEAARGFHQVEEAGLQAIRHIQYIEAEKKRADQAYQTNKGVSDFKLGALADEQEVRTGKDAAGNIVSDPATADNYLPRLATKLADRRSAMLDATADPVVKQSLDAHISANIPVHMSDAYHYSNVLKHQETLGNMQDEIAKSLRLYSQTPSVMLQDIEKARLTNYIKSTVPIVGADVAARATRQYEDEINKYEIGKSVQSGTFDPDYWLGKVDPLVYTAAVTKAAQDADRREAKSQRDNNEVARITYGELMDRAMAVGGQPKLTEAEALNTQYWSLLTGAQRKEIIDMIRSPKVGPSDPATWASVLDRMTTGGGVPEAELRRLHNTKGANGLPLLNDTNFREATTFTISRNDHFAAISRAEAHRSEDKLHAKEEQSLREAMGIAEASLTVTGWDFSARMAAAQNTLKAEYRENQFRRNQLSGVAGPDMPRNEKTEDIHYDVLPGLIQRLSGEVAAEYERLQAANAQSRYKTVEAFKAAYPGDSRQYDGDPYYMKEAKRWQDTYAAKLEYDRLAEEQKRKQAERDARKKQRERTP